MKRFATVLVLLALASTANAAGVSLRWNSCAGQSNRNFACDKGTGSEMLVGSFSPPASISQLSGIEVIVSIVAGDGNTPAWWQALDAGSCRRGSLAATFDVTDQSECDDPWNGQAVGGIGMAAANRVNDTDIPNPAGIDLFLTAAVPIPVQQSVSSGRTYAAFKIIVNHQKSSGASACAGCDTPVCITIDAVRLAQPGRANPGDDGYGSRPNTYTVITDSITGVGGASQVATWQGGASSCAGATSKASTWAELKNRFK